MTDPMNTRWTGEDDLFEELCQQVMGPMGAAFAEIWSGPNGRELMGKFLDRECKFVVARDGISVLLPADGEGAADEPV